MSLRMSFGNTAAWRETATLSSDVTWRPDPIRHAPWEIDAGAARTYPALSRMGCEMRIKKLDHSALVVRDLDRARWFYGEALGLVEVQ